MFVKASGKLIGGKEKEKRASLSAVHISFIALA